MTPAELIEFLAIHPPPFSVDCIVGGPMQTHQKNNSQEQTALKWGSGQYLPKVQIFAQVQHFGKRMYTAALLIEVKKEERR